MPPASPSPAPLPESPWAFPPRVALLDGSLPHDYVASGADLAPATLIDAYQQGLFPMPGDNEGDIDWFCPVRRGVLPLEGLRISDSLRKSRKRFEIRVDTAFGAVMDACADPSRPGAWIDAAVKAAYTELHRLGWAHSVEAWQDGELAGGLYGVSIGGLFAGESMFHRARDASKAALAGLVDLLRGAGDAERRLLDTQWQTRHLATLGVVEVGRADYLRRLDAALDLPDAFAVRT